jgi:tetratricopeptide (TPR) repeat protein
MNSASLFGPGVSSLWSKGRKKGARRSRTGLTAGSNLPADVAAALGEAELHFVNGDNNRAIEMLSEVSLKAPKHPEPYSIMALIYETSGDLEKALPLYALTATYTPKAGSLHQWTKVAELASELGELDQAILALKRCINLAPSPEFYQQKIRLFLRQKNLNNAKSTLSKLFSRFKDQEYFLVEFGNLAMSMGYSDLAISCYTKYIFYLLGTAQVRTDLFLAVASAPVQPPKHTEYILQHVAYLYEALYKATDALVDKPDGQAAAMELVELCGEWTLAVKASLPPDADVANSEVPELPLVVVIIYAGNARTRFLNSSLHSCTLLSWCVVSVQVQTGAGWADCRGDEHVKAGVRAPRPGRAPASSTHWNLNNER